MVTADDEQLRILCCHALKALRVSCPELSRGQIVSFLGTLPGTPQGGLDRLLEFLQISYQVYFPFSQSPIEAGRSIRRLLCWTR